MKPLAVLVASLALVAATDDEIRRILVDRIDVQKQGVGCAEFRHGDHARG
jgi:hypothetical protein